LRGAKTNPHEGRKKKKRTKLGWGVLRVRDEKLKTLPLRP